jgi:hypothetical protein
MFKWLISSWLNVGRSYASISLSISSTLSSLLEYKFSKYSQMVLWISLAFIAISPFSALILLTWFFSLFLLVSLTKSLWIFLSFQWTNSLFHWFYRFLVSISLISVIFIIFSPYTDFGFHLSFFSKSFQSINRLFISDFSDFFMKALITINVF